MEPLEDLVAWTGDKPALLGSRCTACDTHTFPRQGSCPRCGSTDLADAELPTRGTVWTWTVQRFPVKPPFRGPEPFEPFALGYVDLGSVRVETRLDGAPLDGWAIGDEVELAVELLPGEDPDDPAARWAYVFRPAMVEVLS